jgi:hypothetical protein
LTDDAAVAGRAAALVRHRYLVWTRLTLRLVEGATLVATGRDRHALGLAAAVAFVAYDLAVATALRRAGRPHFAPRVVADSLDVAVWTVLIGPAPDIATLAAGPLALELGLLAGWRGFALPALAGVVAAVLGATARQPPSPAPFLWPFAGVVWGVVIIGYLRLLRRRRRRLAALEIQAAAGEAELAGRNSVARGADAVVDELAGAMWMLAAAGVEVAAARAETWRSRLAATSARGATYLGGVLTRWQRARNAMHGDLAADVQLTCPAGAGVLLLSAGQAASLERALERLAPRGTVTVDVPAPAPAGRRQVVDVGGRRVVLCSDPPPAVLPLDPGPIAIAMGAVTSLTHSLPWSDAVPLAITAPLAIAGLVVAWWAQRQVERWAAAAHSGVLLAALALGVADALLSTAAMRSTTADHLARLPFLLFPLWFGPLAVLYWRDLSPARRRQVAVSVGAVIALGFALLPRAVPPGDVLVAAVWPVCATAVSRGWRELLDWDAARGQAGVTRWHEAAVRRAFRRGRRQVIEVTARAVAGGRAAFAAAREELPAAVAAEVERRLVEVERRLAGLVA